MDVTDMANALKENLRNILVLLDGESMLHFFGWLVQFTSYITLASI